jgi:hypothetical protein
LVHIVHGYDYAGNRLYRNDLVQSANSELYSYDNLGQIKTLNRGELNSAQNAVTTVNHIESWNFDKTVHGLFTKLDFMFVQIVSIVHFDVIFLRNKEKTIFLILSRHYIE